jgi:hypothetical protein
MHSRDSCWLLSARSLAFALYLQQTHLYADYSILNAAGHNCLRLQKQIENCCNSVRVMRISTKHAPGKKRFQREPHAANHWHIEEIIKAGVLRFAYFFKAESRPRGKSLALSLSLSLSWSIFVQFHLNLKMGRDQIRHE